MRYLTIYLFLCASCVLAKPTLQDINNDGVKESISYRIDPVAIGSAGKFFSVDIKRNSQVVFSYGNAEYCGKYYLEDVSKSYSGKEITTLFASGDDLKPYADSVTLNYYGWDKSVQRYSLYSVIQKRGKFRWNQLDKARALFPRSGEQGEVYIAIGIANKFVVAVRKGEIAKAKAMMISESSYNDVQGEGHGGPSYKKTLVIIRKYLLKKSFFLPQYEWFDYYAIDVEDTKEISLTFSQVIKNYYISSDSKLPELAIIVNENHKIVSSMFTIGTRVAE